MFPGALHECVSARVSVARKRLGVREGGRRGGRARETLPALRVQKTPYA